MKCRNTFAAVATLIVAAQPIFAAEMTLVRNSRPVTATEVAGGAPLGGMVHDFRLTSDADLLVLGPAISVPVYKHPYNSNYEAPDPELVAAFPAVGASSFLQLPSSTVVLGGGFGVSGSAWGDLSNDGPQTDFLFGRLTTSEPGSFSGDFYVRGELTPVTLPFSFTLPGPSGPLNETLNLFGAEQIQTPYTPPAVDEVTSHQPKPNHANPFPVELVEYSRSLADIPKISPTLASDILALKKTRQQNIVRRGITAGAAAAVPEPASWTLCAVGLPLLRRRAAGHFRRGNRP